MPPEEVGAHWVRNPAGDVADVFDFVEAEEFHGAVGADEVDHGEDGHDEGASQNDAVEGKSGCVVIRGLELGVFAEVDENKDEKTGVDEEIDAAEVVAIGLILKCVDGFALGDEPVEVAEAALAGGRCHEEWVVVFRSGGDLGFPEKWKDEETEVDEADEAGEEDPADIAHDDVRAADAEPAAAIADGISGKVAGKPDEGERRDGAEMQDHGAGGLLERGHDDNGKEDDGKGGGAVRAEARGFGVIGVVHAGSVGGGDVVSGSW